jgi:hypothetical protein
MQLADSRIFHAVISTFIVLIIAPLIGLIIDRVTRLITRAIATFTSSKIANCIMIYVFFFGTVHHELAHAILAWITGARVDKVELFHPKNGTLGSVQFTPRKGLILGSIERVLASSAPITCGFITLTALINYLHTNSPQGVVKGIIYYLIISIFVHMRMSKEDISVYVKGLCVVSIILLVIFYIFNFNILGIMNIWIER